MRARPGDRIVLAADHVDEPTRDGRIIEARGPDGGPPFLVEWSDGHTGLIFPGPGSVLRISTEEQAPPAAASAPPAPASPAPAATPGPGAPGHVREWQIRVSIFESGDETSANVVLVADAPEHLSARGDAHRSSDDTSVPEIGDEVAVARALRHLADKLLETAETDIEMMTGEEAHVRPV